MFRVEGESGWARGMGCDKCLQAAGAGERVMVKIVHIGDGHFFEEGDVVPLTND
ncbi:hypothetical protein D3C86_2264020 [compost metagenome]